MTVIWISQSNKSPVWQSNFQGYVALSLLELSFPLLLFYLFLFLFCFLTNFARAMTLSNLWYDWKRNRSPMGQSDVILLFVHLFLHPRVYFIEVVSNYITRVCTSQMWKSFSSADRRNIIANCKKRHAESMRRKRSLSLLGVGLMLPLSIDFGCLWLWSWCWRIWPEK